MKQAFTCCLLFILFCTSIKGQNRYDIIIDELMADPMPMVGLPNNEWIELKNISTNAINLLNWRIGDASSQSGPLPGYILQPDSFVIICTSGTLASMSVFGNAISVTSFPSLDNDGDIIFLKTATGRTMHAVKYSTDWHANELKKDGGWSLEMVDTHHPCSGADNWTSSTYVSGGTPGKKNSVNEINNNTSLPTLKRAYTIDSVTIVLVYDEPIDSLSGATISNYSSNLPGVISNATSLAPLFNEVQLKIAVAMARQKVYAITAHTIADCAGHASNINNAVSVGLPEEAKKDDWVINEILFNPRPNGFDFVEFYNKSPKVLDASKLFTANRSSTGVVGSLKPLSPLPFLVFPNDYIVVTENAANLALQYLVTAPENVLTVTSPPSFPDAEGTVVALNSQGDIIDEVMYNEDWHFKLIDNPEAVSLERIDPSGPSQNASNWHSAAATTGYGTPTYKNSQYRRMDAVDATIAISPVIFSPDNDGRNDVAILQYHVTENGYLCNTIIYDAMGRPVRNLVQNQLMGLSGSWTWDGLDDKGQQLNIGIYVARSEIFNLQGKKKLFKTAIVLTRKLK